MTIEDFRKGRQFREREQLGDPFFGPYRRRPSEHVTRVQWQRHTDDIDRTVESLQSNLRRDRLWGWCTFWCLVGAAIGYGVGRFVLPMWVGG